MPVLKHAKKKLRQDKKRTSRNRKIKDTYKALVKKARTLKTLDAINAAFSGLDKAAKNHIIHKNKAARLKSSLSKTVSGGEKSETAKPVVKKAKSTKTPVKKTVSKKPRAKK